MGGIPRPEEGQALVAIDIGDHFVLTIYCMSASLDAIGLALSLILFFLFCCYFVYQLSKVLCLFFRWVFQVRRVVVYRSAVDVDICGNCVIIRSVEGELLDVIVM